MTPEPNDDRRLTRIDVARQLAVSDSTVIRYEKAGYLTSHRVGPRMIRFWASDVSAFQNSRNQPIKLPPCQNTSIPRETRRAVESATLVPMGFEIYSKTKESARLILRVGRPLTYNAKFEIYRIYIGENGERATESGFPIGSSKSDISAGIIDVLPSDILFVEFEEGFTLSRKIVSFKVGHDFTVSLTNPAITPDLEDGLWAEIGSLGSKEIHPWSVRESLFRQFMQSPHKGWVKTVVEAQIEDWKGQSGENLIHYAPDLLTEDQLLRFPQKLPGSCLIYIKDRLSPEQLDHCITAAPDAAVMYAFELMTERHIDNAVEKCPEILLEYAASKLTDKHLRACAYASPETAFDVSRKMAPAVHALLFSYTIAILGDLWHETLFVDLQEEASKSLHDFPEVWLETYQGDQDRLMATLQQFLELDFGIKIQLDQAVGVPPPQIRFKEMITAPLRVRGRLTPTTISAEDSTSIFPS